MYGLRGMILILGVLLLLGPVSAEGEGIPYAIQGDSNWIVANGTDSTSIHLYVTDVHGNPVQGASVILQSEDPAYGSVSTQVYTTRLIDGLAVYNGNELPRFTASRRSGVAPILVSASKLVETAPYQITATFEQQIDHDTPYRYSAILRESSVPANESTPITIVLSDRYGNRVDSRKETDVGGIPEQIQFSVASPENGARFSNGQTTITGTVDQGGNTTIFLRVSPISGDNIIQVLPLSAPVSPIWLTLTSFGAVPAMMYHAVSPPGTPCPSTPADGESQFTITYALYDAWGNPVRDHLIHITTSLGEEGTVGPTNSYGQALFRYGPKSTIGPVNIQASVVGHPEVTCSQLVEFTAGDPLRLRLTVSSTTMSSLDVNPATRARVRAKILDMQGNPVQGETVTFQISENTIGSFNQTQAPALSNTSAVTDDNGYAVVDFIPGAFSTDPAASGYSPMATGTCTVVAEWNSSIQSVRLAYKNYPYIRVETEVSNTTLEAGGDLDVTLRIIGDGHELSARGPVDVILATSRAHSMLEENPDRMVFAYTAEHAFIDMLQDSPPQGNADRVGLLTFGSNPNGRPDILTMASQFKKLAGIDNTDGEEDTAYVGTHYAGNNVISYTDSTPEVSVTLDEPLTTDLLEIDDAIDLTIPWGNKAERNQPCMPLRRAVYEAITTLRTDGTNSMQAVVLLVDSDITDYGDVLAQGSYDYTWSNMKGGTNRYYPFPGPDGSWDPDVAITPEQNMAVYARNNDVRIYVVYAASSINTADYTTLNTLAAESGGAFNSTNGDASNLQAIYSWIADQIMIEAAVNATMDLHMVAFDESTNITYTAEDLFEYRHVHAPPVNSTEIFHYSWAGTDPYTPATTLDRTTFDQTSDWLDDSSLHFDIGTLNIKETWQATFRLHVREDVNQTLEFRLFGPGTTIQFENDPGSSLDLYNSSPLLTLVPTMNASAINPTTLDISDLRQVSGNTLREFSTFAWHQNYTGNETVRGQIAYQFQDPGTGLWSTPTVFGTDDLTGPVDADRSKTLDARNLAYGTYRIQVSAEAADGPHDEESMVILVQPSSNYIRLE